MSKENTTSSMHCACPRLVQCGGGGGFFVFHHTLASLELLLVSLCFRIAVLQERRRSRRGGHNIMLRSSAKWPSSSLVGRPLLLQGIRSESDATTRFHRRRQSSRRRHTFLLPPPHCRQYSIQFCQQLNNQRRKSCGI